MDYKYIEQLLERYWACETSLEEEEILRAFFSQKDIPASLQGYRPLFAAQQEEKKLSLDDDFDARMLSIIGETDDAAAPKAGIRVKAREIKLTQRLMPLFKAAAVVAIILTLGNAANVSLGRLWSGDHAGAMPTAQSTEARDTLNLVSDGTMQLLPSRPDSVQVNPTKSEVDSLIRLVSSEGARRY